MKSNGSEIIIYQTPDGLTKVDVRMDGETLWLTQAHLIELYQSSKSNISEHIHNILQEKELDELQLSGISEQFKDHEVMSYFSFFHFCCFFTPYN